MTIFRTEHNKNYVVVNNFICKDSRLSWKAKGIWLYAFSRPDDWTFRECDLINQSTDGRDSVRAGLKELQEFGYLIKEKQSRKDDKFSNAEWVFYETPQELKKSLPQTGFPSTENQTTENPPLLSIESLPSIEGNDNAAMPLKSEFKENIEILKTANLEADDHSLEFLARTHTKQKLLDALNHLSREIEKGTKIKKSKIAFFRYILSGDVSIITQQASINKKWSEDAKKGMPWPSLVIHEKYAECSFCMKEIPFDMTKSEFGEAMANMWELSKRQQQ